MKIPQVVRIWISGAVGTLLLVVAPLPAQTPPTKEVPEPTKLSEVIEKSVNWYENRSSGFL